MPYKLFGLVEFDLFDLHSEARSIVHLRGKFIRLAVKFI